MSRPTLRILLVEDEPSDALLVDVFLREAQHGRFELTHVSSLAEAQERLARDRFDAVLLDLGLPDGRGIEVVEGVMRCVEETPVVVLTGSSDRQLAVEAVSRGAQDYLEKDGATTDSLERVLNYAIARHQLVTELKRTNALLDQRNNELKEANGLLDEKNRRMGHLYEQAHQFVDHVSHEFRTPLTVIKEFVTIIRDGLVGHVSQQQREFLDIVNDRADDLAIMTDDMLDVSKFEAGLLSAWRKRCRLSEILEHVRPILQRKATIKKLRLSIDCDEDDAESAEAARQWVYCDPDKVGRVIINLTINALKYGGEDGEVRLWARREPGGDAIRIGVTDDGPGIDEDKLRLIFERFHQIGSTVHSSTKGFGLGLSIAKELVELNFGGMDVESRTDQGSTFSFTIPICDPVVLTRRYLDRLALWEDARGQCALLSVVVPSPTDPASHSMVDECLQHQFRGRDLVFSPTPGRWIVLAGAPEPDTRAMIAAVKRDWVENSANRPEGALPSIVVREIGRWNVAQPIDDCLTMLEKAIHPAPAPAVARRVLVADDEPEVLRGLSIRLQSNGYQVTTAKDGRAALERAMANPPDVVLLDNYMPGKSGMEVLDALHEHPATADIPVVMISASRRDEHEALRRGARFFLEKPCDPVAVSTALEQAMAGEETLQPA